MLIHGVELVVHPDRRALFDGLRSPADVIAKYGASVPPAERRSAVAELHLPQGHFFLKIYAYSGLWRLRTLFIVSRAGREYRNLIRLAALGFNVPEPVASGQARTLGFVGESFVMTRAIEDSVSMWTYVYNPGAAPFPLPDARERHRLIEDFARTLRQAHEERFFIHTLRAKNVLLTEENGVYKVHLIDVPFAGIWRWRFFPRAGRIRDLALILKWARVLLTRTERMRFARAYGAGPGLLRETQAYQERYYPLRSGDST
ncbi:MAG TPA: lipopolysaccharide kinase InaA family protein [Planctomycetota bacterium]|nr:lipopolysaccharide kinase InaA family protein [Planctomycetota bacterium]